MRVLRLGLGEGRTIDLHPAVSVVAGLSGAERTALRRGFTSISTGLAPDHPGLIEAHGLLLDATQDDLDLLEVPAVPVLSVATVAEVAPDLPADQTAPVRTAERDLLLLAGDRWRCAGAARGREAPPLARPPDPARAGLLRARIDRHRARDPEAVRAALDEMRDAHRSGRDRGGVQHLGAALAGVGLDAAGLDLAADELVRIAEDWLDERRREAEWVVGAEVELAAIEAPADNERVGHDTVDVSARAVQATRVHGGAVVRLDQLQAEVVGSLAPTPGASDLVTHLLGRLGTHRPARLAGAVPLVLDGVLDHLGDDDVTRVLDRAVDLAGAVQLVMVDDHPAARAWAEAAGIRSAAVVEAVPEPPPVAPT